MYSTGSESVTTSLLLFTCVFDINVLIPLPLPCACVHVYIVKYDKSGACASSCDTVKISSSVYPKTKLKDDNFKNDCVK